MNLDYTSEEQAFREKVATWIAGNAPRLEERRDIEVLRGWQKKLHSAGFLGAGWPAEHGGAQLTSMQQAILNEELARANAPQPINIMALWWVGPAIIRYGTEAQKQRF